ncbi:hypothetical protein BDR26DRAFT_431496 [Obelidium mucronatum]|nr:hypothetical protein BDR26DRAFT_431496 [Obelidium mucronatum]
MFIAAAILFSCTVSAKINITLGIVSNYCSIQNLSYIGSLVLDYNTTFTNTIDAYGLSGYVYFNDIAFLAAVNAINSRSDMSLWVNIKRFSDCGNKWYPAVEQFSGNSGGWASSIMVQDIWDKHKDVVAVVADEYSTTARGPSQALSYYQIPYCSSASSAPGFSDKNKNPYFWRPLPGVEKKELARMCINS